MKYVLVTLLFFTSSMIVRSQGNKRSTYSDQPFLVSLGGNVGFPIGNTSNTFSYDLGGDIQVEYKPSEQLGFTANAGYISYKKKDVKVNSVIDYKGTIAFKIGMLGVKYTFPNDVFLHGQAGLAFSPSVIGTKICYAPGIGYDFSRNFDIEIKYFGIRGAGESNDALSTINLRVGYNF